MSKIYTNVLVKNGCFGSFAFVHLFLTGFIYSLYTYFKPSGRPGALGIDFRVHVSILIFVGSMKTKM